MADNLYSTPSIGSTLYGEMGAEAPLVTPQQTSGRQARIAAIANANVTTAGQGFIQDLEALTDEYKETISKSGDKTVRYQAAAQQQVNQLAGLNNLLNGSRGFDPTGEVANAVYGAAQAVMAETLEQREKYALEQKAVEQIQDLAAQGDYVQAKLLLNNLELGTAEDRLRDIDTKRLILMREIENAGIAKEDQGWFSDAADFVMDFIPLNRSLGQAGNVEISKGLKHWYDSLFAGQRLRNEAASLWQMDPASFSDYVKEVLIPNIRENSTLLGVHSNSEELDLLTSMYSTAPAWQTNAMNTIDNVGLLPSLKTLKLSTSIPSTLIRQGARKEAADTIAKTVLDMTMDGVDNGAAKNGIEPTEVIQNLVPSSVNIDGALNAVPVTGDAVTALQRAQALLAELPRLQETERFLSEAEKTAAATATLKQIEKEFGRELKDIKLDVLETELAGQSKTHVLELTLGKKTGGGYASEKQAREFANSLGYDTAEIIRDESGQWFAKIKKDFSEIGFYTNPLNVQQDSVAWRLLRGARQVSDLDLADMAQVAGNRRNKLLKDVVKPTAEKFNTLKRFEREALEQILSKGTNESRWFTNDQINILMQRGYGRNATQAELDAYLAYRNLNDVEWALRNDEVYKDKVLRGFETASFETPLGSIKETNVQINRNLDVVPRDRVYNVNDNIHYSKNQPLTAQDLERFKAQGYILVKLENSVKLSDGTRVQTFLIKGRDLSLKPLRREQVAYRAGGHVMYKGKYFGKQGRKGRQPDTLEEFYDAPSTFISGSRREVQQWAETMERARLTYKQMQADGAVDLNAIDEIFEGRAGYPTAKEFVEGIDDGTYQLDNPFETVFDRELPSMYNSVDADAIQFAQGESGLNSLMRTQGRMYYSPRGERLKDYKGDLAPTLDPFETVNNALMNVANIVSFSDYKISAVERWVKQFRNYTNLKDLDSKTDMAIFRDAVINTSNDRIKQAAIAQRNIIRRNLGWKSEQDLQAEQFTRRLHEWVFNAEPGSLGSKVESRITDWWDNKNPVMALRGIAFDMKLGLFNIAQFPLQIGTALAATTLSPIHGMHGWVTVAPMRAYLTKSGTEHMLQTLVDRGLHKASGFKTEAEFKEMFRAAKTSGFFDIGGTHGLINDYGPNAAVSDFTGRVNRAREAGRFFFNEAEIWNRSVAWHIAWKEMRAAFPDLGSKSPEFLRRVAGRAEDYSFGMSEQSGAIWQKGLASVPTQFWAYQARMMEALLGKTFTPEQRLRLAIGQTLMWGSAGLPVLPWLSEQYKESVGPEYIQQQPFSTFFRVADRGLFDWVIQGMTGADIQFGKKFGTGSWFTDTVRDIFGFGQYGEKSFAEMAGGATFNIIFGDNQLAETMMNVVDHMVAEAGGRPSEPVKPEVLQRLAQNISTASNIMKAYWVFQYGTYRTNTGTTVMSDAPTSVGVAALFGFQPGEYDSINAMMSFNKNEAEIVKEAAKVVSQYRTRMVNEPASRQDIAEEINTYMAQFPPELRQRILRKTNREFDSSLYDGLLKQAQQRTAQ